MAVSAALSGRSSDDEDSGSSVGNPFVFYMVNSLFQIVFGILANLILMWFSRWREYRADAGAAQALGSPAPMINALARLGGMQTSELPGNVKGFGISGGMGSLFATHPPIEARIKALRELQN